MQGNSNKKNGALLAAIVIIAFALLMIGGLVLIIQGQEVLSNQANAHELREMHTE